VFDEAGISELLVAPAASGVPGCSGTRNLRDNLSDLRAQVAANQRGIALVRELIAEHGLRTVKAYMMHIRNAAERAVRAMLVRFSHAQGLPDVGTVRAVDYLDDGTPIALAVTIDRTTGSAIFDFTGTGQQVHGNLNAPPAVTYSAVIYALRCMVREDIPLNQGCLAPITCILPDECVLKPCATAAVVGGNVLTSQRVTDVVLKAFAAAAASQGCMNNLTFGDSGLGYYETIAGGAGAGPGFHGRSGVHTHMTNTRITDPEILERRFPVVLRAFTLRQGSGGAGRWRGGDGVIRELEVLRPLTVGILSERRSLPPFGLQGGADAQRGLNLWLQARLTTPQGRIPVDGIERSVSLGAKATVLMQPGDRLRVLTPGGGGFGDQTSGAEDGPGLLQGRAPSGTTLREGGSVDAYRRAQESV
jgi:5-oxoprolinase (ATP-hydrolysing)